MPETRDARVADVVKSALEHDASEWAGFLQQACGGDSDLLAEAESLLNFRGSADHLLEEHAIHLGAELFVEDETLKEGERVDHYEVRSLIGAGGMGEVYLAQDLELGRKVALKLIKSGFGSASFLRRFRAEEKILAGLNHPNIAQLYGAGATAAGVPYFVMEYVDGTRLDQFCEARDLPLPGRLELFRKVCAAVAYAHQNLVIHRDIKPPNILVTQDGEPKLLDFGIAKLLDDATAGELEQTMSARGIMTPEYASPEQVRGETMTTASDVYSLGVILYVLLTGERPYRLTSSQPTERARAITDQQPTRPSQVTPAGPKSTFRNRKALKGDLDNIVLMAMRKEPGRRYTSVGQLSEDIRRHLAGLPVIARKDTFRYRSSKFVKRHRFSVAAAALVFLSLLAGIVTTAWEARAAREEKAKAETINAFLEQMINYSNPILNLARDTSHPTTMTEALDEAAKRLEGDLLARQPEVRADLERIIAFSYHGQGKRHEADQHFQNYIAQVNKLYGKDHPKALAASSFHASQLFNGGELSEAEKLFRLVLPRMRREQVRGAITVNNLAETLNDFACLRRTQGDSREAELLFRELLALGPKLPQEAHYLVATTRSTLASTLADEGKFDEALQTARAAVEEGRQTGPANAPSLGFSLTILGGFLTDTREFEKADVVLTEAEGILRKLMSPTNLWLGDNLRNQSISFYRQGKFTEAQEKVSETLKLYLENFGPHYDQYPTAMITQGLIWDKSGKTKEAETILREAFKLRRDSLPPEHFWVAMAEGALGECLTTQGRWAEAEPLLTQSYETLKSRFGVEDPRTQEAFRRRSIFADLSRKPGPKEVAPQ